jgi:hypothetical protein
MISGLMQPESTLDTDYSYKQIVHSDLELFPVSVRKSLFWFARI